MATKRDDNGPYDLDAILDDPRNWRGQTGGQKDQAILRQIVRQSNGPDMVKGCHIPPAIGGTKAISLAQIEHYTGIKRETALPLLAALRDRGFIRYEVENPGKPGAVYRAKLRDRNVGNWPVKYKHRRGNAGGRDCPF